MHTRSQELQDRQFPQANPLSVQHYQYIPPTQRQEIDHRYSQPHLWQQPPIVESQMTQQQVFGAQHEEDLEQSTDKCNQQQW